MIENVLNVQREVKVKSLFSRRSTRSLWTTGRRNSFRVPTASGPDNADGWTRSGRPRRSGSITAIDCSKSKGAADAQVNDDRRRRRSKVSRNDPLTRKRRQIEVAKLCARDRRQRAVRVRTSKAWTLVDLAIEIPVLTGDDIEGLTGVRDHHHLRRESVAQTRAPKRAGRSDR